MPSTVNIFGCLAHEPLATGIPALWGAAVPKAKPQPPEPWPTGPCPSGSPFKLNVQVPHCSKAEVAIKLFRIEQQRWCRQKGRRVGVPTVNASLAGMFNDWFSIVDADGSGALQSDEVVTQMQGQALPFQTEVVRELVAHLDWDGNGEVDWSEFSAFLSQEIALGKDVFSSDFVLPSGRSLALGPILGLLRRKRMMTEIFQGGEARSNWDKKGPQILDAIAAQREQKENKALQEQQDILREQANQLKELRRRNAERSQAAAFSDSGRMSISGNTPRTSCGIHTALFETGTPWLLTPRGNNAIVLDQDSRTSFSGMTQSRGGSMSGQGQSHRRSSLSGYASAQQRRSSVSDGNALEPRSSAISDLGPDGTAVSNGTAIVSSDAVQPQSDAERPLALQPLPALPEEGSFDEGDDVLSSVIRELPKPTQTDPTNSTNPTLPLTHTSHMQPAFAGSRGTPADSGTNKAGVQAPFMQPGAGNEAQTMLQAPSQVASTWASPTLQAPSEVPRAPSVAAAPAVRAAQAVRPCSAPAPGTYVPPGSRYRRDFSDINVSDLDGGPPEHEAMLHQMGQLLLAHQIRKVDRSYPLPASVSRPSTARPATADTKSHTAPVAAQPPSVTSSHWQGILNWRDSSGVDEAITRSPRFSAGQPQGPVTKLGDANAVPQSEVGFSTLERYQPSNQPSHAPACINLVRISPQTSPPGMDEIRGDGAHESSSGPSSPVVPKLQLQLMVAGMSGRPLTPSSAARQSLALAGKESARECLNSSRPPSSSGARRQPPPDMAGHDSWAATQAALVQSGRPVQSARQALRPSLYSSAPPVGEGSSQLINSSQPGGAHAVGSQPANSSHRAVESQADGDQPGSAQAEPVAADHHVSHDTSHTQLASDQLMSHMAAEATASLQQLRRKYAPFANLKDPMPVLPISVPTRAQTAPPRRRDGTPAGVFLAAAGRREAHDDVLRTFDEQRADGTLQGGPATAEDNQQVSGSPRAGVLADQQAGGSPCAGVREALASPRMQDRSPQRHPSPLPSCADHSSSPSPPRTDGDSYESQQLQPPELVAVATASPETAGQDMVLRPNGTPVWDGQQEATYFWAAITHSDGAGAAGGVDAGARATNLAAAAGILEALQAHVDELQYPYSPVGSPAGYPAYVSPPTSPRRHGSPGMDPADIGSMHRGPHGRTDAPAGSHRQRGQSVVPFTKPAGAPYRSGGRPATAGGAGDEAGVSGRSKTVAIVLGALHAASQPNDSLRCESPVRAQPVVPSCAHFLARHTTSAAGSRSGGTPERPSSSVRPCTSPPSTYASSMRHMDHMGSPMRHMGHMGSVSASPRRATAETAMARLLVRSQPTDWELSQAAASKTRLVPPFLHTGDACNSPPTFQPASPSNPEGAGVAMGHCSPEDAAGAKMLVTSSIQSLPGAFISHGLPQASQDEALSPTGPFASAIKAGGSRKGAYASGDQVVSPTAGRLGRFGKERASRHAGSPPRLRLECSTLRQGSSWQR